MRRDIRVLYTSAESLGMRKMDLCLAHGASDCLKKNREAVGLFSVCSKDARCYTGGRRKKRNYIKDAYYSAPRSADEKEYIERTKFSVSAIWCRVCAVPRRLCADGIET